MRGEFDVHHLAGLAFRPAVPAGEHELRVGKFVVDDQEPPLGVVRSVGERQKAREVGIIAALAGLLCGALSAGVELGSIGHYGIAPSDDDRMIIAGWYAELVVRRMAQRHKPSGVRRGFRRHEGSDAADQQAGHTGFQ
jgi:hypothetical protein